MNRGLLGEFNHAFISSLLEVETDCPMALAGARRGGGMNIDVHIERLILDGVPVAHSQRPLLQAAVEDELARLLVADGLGPELLSSGALPAVRPGGMQLTNDGNPIRLGQQIAQAVYGGIGNKPRKVLNSETRSTSRGNA